MLDNVFNQNAVDPDIMRLDDGRYRMYYFLGRFVQPYPPSSSTSDIYSAISTDGLNFTIEGKAFSYPTIITDPTVVRLPNGNYLMAVSGGSKIIFASSTNGTTFTITGVEINHPGIPELSVLTDGSVRLYYQGPGGILSYKSIDNGSSWNNEGVRLMSQQLFVADPSVVRTGDGKWIMFVKGSNSTGASGPSGHNVMMAESQDGNIFGSLSVVLLDSASVPEGVVFSTSTTSIPGLIDPKTSIPKSFYLEQNFPNPFNPTTTISYEIPVDGHRTLTVYDIFGRELSTLASGFHFAGSYTVQWNADRFPSGIYFYRLQADRFVEIKKMIFQK